MNNIVLITPVDERIPLQHATDHFFMPRYGLLSVGSALKREGFSVKAYCEQSGSRIDWDVVFSSDVVCFSLLSINAAKGYEYAARVRARSSAPIVFGGPHASSLPEDCLPHCDYVVRSEGEKALVELLRHLSAGLDASDVRGVSYRDAAGRIHHNPEGEPVDDINWPVDHTIIEGYRARHLGDRIVDLVRRGIPRVNIVVSQTSRGCPYDCEFCFVKTQQGRKYRKRDPEVVVREIEQGVEALRTNLIILSDNDFTLDRNHALRVLRLLADRFHGNLDMFFFSRIFIARDRELMEAIEKAGRVVIAVGVESVEPGTLKLFKKGQTLEDIHECLELFSRYRIQLQPLFVFGADTDTLESVRKALDLSLKFSTRKFGFCSLYDLPTRESVLGDKQCIPDARFIHRDWRFFSGNFVVHYPMRMRPSALQSEMLHIQRQFYHENHATPYQFHRTVAAVRDYIPLLRETESGLYDTNDRLIEERLPGPLADQRQLPIRFHRYKLIDELARFYFMNLVRPVAWRYFGHAFGQH